MRNEENDRAKENIFKKCKKGTADNKENLGLNIRQRDTGNVWGACFEVRLFSLFYYLNKKL